jgi:hypothetical protein
VAIIQFLNLYDVGGGLALGCDKDLHPVWLGEGEENVEALCVEISGKWKFAVVCMVHMRLIDRKEHFGRIWMKRLPRPVDQGLLALLLNAKKMQEVSRHEATNSPH